MLELLVAGPIVVLLGLLGWERRMRRRFVADDDVFECRARALGAPPATWRRLRGRWSRIMSARWDGPVLVIRRGPVSVRTLRLPARVSSSIYLIAPDGPEARGMRRVAVRLLAGGGEIELSTLEFSRIDLVGPYLVAATPSLPAPARRREI